MLCPAQRSMDLFLQAFLSKTIDTPALDLPPLGDEVREGLHQLCILETVGKQFLHLSCSAGRPWWGGADLRLRLQVSKKSMFWVLIFLKWPFVFLVLWNIAGPRNSVPVPIRSQSLSETDDIPNHSVLSQSSLIGLKKSFYMSDDMYPPIYQSTLFFWSLLLTCCSE